MNTWITTTFPNKHTRDDQKKELAVSHSRQGIKRCPIYREAQTGLRLDKVEEAADRSVPEFTLL